MCKSKPTLVVMAAGMGSRYGGLKQIDPVTENGEIILDFSLYDAERAGFEKAVFVIREENLEDFHDILDDGAAKHVQIEYAFQKTDDLPPGFEVPQGRKKPWGTGHAILSAKDKVDASFAVINGDDYYGPEAFKKIYNFLEAQQEENRFAMVAYELKNTITQNGHVSRGVCTVEDEFLTDIVERSKIMRINGKTAFEDEDGKWMQIDENTPVSMNLWGYGKMMMDALEDGFEDFLMETIKKNPLKGEYLLPKVTDKLIKEGKADCKVLFSQDRWHGITYREDKQQVSEAMRKLREQGVYPEKLWK